MKSGNAQSSFYLGSKRYPSIYKFFRKKVNLNVEKASCILDAGCGSNSVLKTLSQFGFGVALDIDRANLRLSRNTLGSENVAFIVASVENLPFRKEVFDLVTMRDVVEHLKNIEKALSETVHCLKTRGKIIITTTNLFNPVIFLDHILPKKVTQKIVVTLGGSNIYAHERSQHISPFHLFRICHGFIIKELAMFSQPPFFQVYRDKAHLPQFYYFWIAFEKLTNLTVMQNFKEMMLIILEKVSNGG